MKYIIIAILALIAGAAFGQDLPNPDLTPGQLRDGITAEQLCPVAHTAKVRNVPQSLKREVYQRYGLSGNHTGYCSGKEGCEVDHLCSLEIGGSNDITNLWPEPYSGSVWNAHTKDRLENEMHKHMCARELTPQEACDLLRGDWTKAYQQYLGDP